MVVSLETKHGTTPGPSRGPSFQKNRKQGLEPTLCTSAQSSPVRRAGGKELRCPQTDARRRAVRCTRRSVTQPSRKRSSGHADLGRPWRVLGCGK